MRHLRIQTFLHFLIIGINSFAGAKLIAEGIYMIGGLLLINTIIHIYSNAATPVINVHFIDGGNSEDERNE